MWTLVAAVAFGAPVEEIVVYGDPFARWDGTRWLVQAEMMLPFPVVFARDAVQGFRSHAFQIRAVVACDKDARLGRHRYEVMCAIEDIGLAATTQGRWRTPGQVAGIQGILDEVDAKLTGATVQLQVDDRGALRNVDIEGLQASTDRERENLEGLRQVVARMMSGFHLQVPPGVPEAWEERDSLLLKMPSTNGVRGYTVIRHEPLESDGHRIFRSDGGGTVAMQIPLPREGGSEIDLSPPEPIKPLPTVEIGPANPAKKLSVPPLKFPPPELFETEREMIDPGYSVIPLLDSDVIDVEVIYELQHLGVAVYDADLGFVSERIWVVRGDPTPSSAGGVSTAPFWSSGRLQLLGSDDRPEVGASQQVVPASCGCDLPPWEPLDLL